MNIHCRWPPVYNQEDLENIIKELTNDETKLRKNFYQTIIKEKNTFYQGDIISFKKDINPIFINANGKFEKIKEFSNFWLVLGNTCDISQCLEQYPEQLLSSSLSSFTLISPLYFIPDSCPENIKKNFITYKFYKRFFYPSWSKEIKKDLFFDLRINLTINCKLLQNYGNIKARLTFRSWILFNASIVRFLARDDGRYD